MQNSDPKTIKFRQIFVTDHRVYGLDISGQMWASTLASTNGFAYPVDRLQWLKCAMPVEVA